MKRLQLFFALFAIPFLFGCGDDQINEITEENRLSLDVYSDIKDLPDCDSDAEGKIVWVTAKERSYACSDNEWVAYAKGMTPKEHSIECSTRELEDGSGVKVVCDGDSIGVLQYGEDGGAENVMSKPACVLQMLTSDSLKLECDSSSKLMSIDELLASMGESYEVVFDSEQVAVRLENIDGFSQKGPFLTGSEVVAYEIENGRTLKQTGTKFEGRISNDDGSFNIRSVKLASQYGFVSVNGFYRNEVSGGVSNVRITLNAISDFRNRNRANVNVLTHMEYARILHLVTKEKYRFAEAKKKAEQEIWKVFRVEDEDFLDNAEDLNIAGSGEGDAALLAVSILLQRDGDAGDLQSLVTNIGNAIAKDGKWENDSLDAAIADWAVAADLSGDYARIRANIAEWGLSAKVADFEPYLRNYWQSVLGVPACSDENDGSIAFVQNKKSEYYSTDISRLAMKCIADTHRWVPLTDEEKDVFDWKDTLDGALRVGSVNSTILYVFDSTGALSGKKGWRRVSGLVEHEFGGCRQELFGDTVYIQEIGRNFVCDENSHRWKGTTAFSVVNPQIWPKGSDGDIRWNNEHTECEIFDERVGIWRMPESVEECNQQLMGCTFDRVGEISHSPVDGSYQGCYLRYSSWMAFRAEDAKTEEACSRYCDRLRDSLHVDRIPDSLFTCKLWDPDGYWEYDESTLEMYRYCEGYLEFPKWVSLNEDWADRYWQDCDGRDTAWGRINPDILYACKNGRMEPVNDMEKMLGVYCHAGVVGSLTSNNKYVCKDTLRYGHSYAWVLATIYDVPLGMLDRFNDSLNYGVLEDTRDGKTYKTISIEGSGIWMAENLNFRDDKNYFYLRNGKRCVNINGEECASVETVYNMSCSKKDDSECSYLGTVYTWNAAMNIDSKWNYETASKVDGLITTPHQGICPDGWHIPTEEEWLGLVRAFAPGVESLRYNDAESFVSAFIARNINEWPDATNESGFTILPFYEWTVGFYYKEVMTYSTSYYSSFISATTPAIRVSDNNFSYYSSEDMGSGSVRCKKDDAVEDGD